MIGNLLCVSVLGTFFFIQAYIYVIVFNLKHMSKHACKFESHFAHAREHVLKQACIRGYEYTNVCMY